MEKIIINIYSLRKVLKVMNVSQMKNIIVLKDLPSNLVDEAIVILKKGSKVRNKKALERTNTEGFILEDTNCEVAIKEAEILIGEYMNELENPNQSIHNIKKMNFKYKKIKLACVILGGIFILRRNNPA